MSDETTVNTFRPINDRIHGVIERLEAFMETVDDALPLPREAAEFVHALTLALRARVAVEIGTSYGYSGLWIASAVAYRGGKLITIDHDERKTEAARRTFEEAGLADAVEFKTGKALDLLGDINDPIDFVLNDADKANCGEYARILAPKLSERGVLLTDNTRTHADELADFIQWIRKRAEFVSTGIPIGNGMELSVQCRIA